MADVTATASENEVVADVIKNLFDPDRPNDNRLERSPKNIGRVHSKYWLSKNSQYRIVHYPQLIFSSSFHLEKLLILLNCYKIQKLI